MGVGEPAYGWVPASSVLPASGDVDDRRPDPPAGRARVRVPAWAPTWPERDCTADDVLDATERVVGGIEVIDSRYEAFKFTLPDVIADNTSAARVAIGDAGVAPRDGRSA